MNEKIPKPMLNALAREAAPADHPSADVLAAFVEHALAEGEKQSVTDHLARCEECREIVFLTSDATEEEVQEPAGKLVAAAALGEQDHLVVEQAGASIQHPVAAAKPRWRSTSKWVWAVPVAAMFLLGAGYLLRKSYVAAPAAREIASKTAPEKASGPPEQLPEATPAPPAPGAAAPSPVAKAQPRTAPATSVLSQRSQSFSGNVNAMNTPAPAESETERAKLTPAKPLPQAPLMAIGGAMAGAAPVAPPPRNSFAPATGETDRQFPADSLSLSVNRALVGAVRTAHPGWRVTLQGHLEHLMSEGWSRVLADQTSAFRAVSVIGNDVWAGGNDGMLFHSGDGGVHWNRLSIPSASGTETVTIVSIRFDDAQHGVVVADTGASYGTTDGGVTWTKR